MRVYHQRMRDGERVAWVCDGGRRLRRLDRGPVDPTRQVLIDALGPAVDARLCEEWEAAAAAEWDATEAEIREWAAGRA